MTDDFAWSPVISPCDGGGGGGESLADLTRLLLRLCFLRTRLCWLLLERWRSGGAASDLLDASGRDGSELARVRSPDERT